LLSETDVPFIRNVISVLPRGEQSSDKSYERLAEGLMRGIDKSESVEAGLFNRSAGIHGARQPFLSASVIRLVRATISQNGRY
jgi:hypothetical protein